jgi:hypothetical protein
VRVQIGANLELAGDAALVGKLAALFELATA